MENDVAPLESLLVHLDRLLGGELPIGPFIQWFNNLEWEDLIADDSSAVLVVFDIENVLQQMQDFPGTFDRDKARALLTELRDLLSEEIERLMARGAHPAPANSLSLTIGSLPLKSHRQSSGGVRRPFAGAVRPLVPGLA